ncbi:MAG: GntR family transcriptional regulator [Emergencia sp.]|nr:GntR family transcriptional regulator [Emergencia sp.]
MKRYKTLKDHVYDYIAEQILEGTLLPSERINETAISQELSVSRTPVREALIQLSCEGILDNVPRKGFVLSEVTEKEASQLYAVIGTLDGMAAKSSCNALTEKDLQQMDFYIQSMELAIKTSNYELYLEHQDAFHQVYMDKCDNDVLTDTITRLKSKFFTRGYSKNNPNQDEDLLYSINEEHRHILELFRGKDGDALSDYLSKTHWAPTHAHNELISRKK